MIAQEQKPMEEILGYLEGKQKVVVMGCGGCATFYRTGDKKAVNEMADKQGCLQNAPAVQYSSL
jgi:hypothetical protein